MRRFYAAPEQINEDVVILSTDETRHLRDVLRLKTGDDASVFDGEGKEFLCKILEIKKSAARLQIIRGIEPSAPESTLEITLAASIYKTDKLDLVVQKAVELGITRFLPVVSERSEIKLRDTLKRTDRWRKIALEATKQCERARIMTIEEPVAFEMFIGSVDRDTGLLLMFSEKDGDGVPSASNVKKITALVGPKGGWDDSEIELAGQSGFTPVKLGRRIMRAETAAITFAALLQHRFGDLN